MSGLRRRAAVNAHDDHMALLVDGRWQLLRQISGDDWYVWCVSIEDTGQSAEDALTALMGKATQP
ncbi:MAG: hypothetical protein KC442_11655 [Thermomicrobiales bacterium]|nr:hypothetical protein [Thermomicrobiales bacterium]